MGAFVAASDLVSGTPTSAGETPGETPALPGTSWIVPVAGAAWAEKAIRCNSRIVWVRTRGRISGPALLPRIARHLSPMIRSVIWSNAIIAFRCCA